MTEKIVKEIIDMRNPIIIAIAVTSIVFFILLFTLRNFKISSKLGAIHGLFVGLQNRSAIHLSFSWAKLVFFFSVVILMRISSLGIYLLFIALAIGTAFFGRNTKLVIMEGLDLVLGLSGIWICSVFVDYMQSVRVDLYVLGAYWVIVVFMILCAIAIFLYEVMYISQEREPLATNIKKKQIG